MCLGIGMLGKAGVESIGGSWKSCPGCSAADLGRRMEALLRNGVSEMGGEENSILN